MEDDDTKYTLIIDPNAFDDFNGTQEELDELVEQLENMVESGEIFDHAEPIDLEGLEDGDIADAELTDEFAEWLRSKLNNPGAKRTIH